MTTTVRRRPSQKQPHSDAVVIGIDQSYSQFAVVVLPQDAASPAVTHVGRFDMKKAGRGIDRLLVIEDWLEGVMLIDAPIRHVCLEGYAHGRKTGREQAGELGAVVKMALRTLGDPVGYPTIVAPASLKKFVTGKGNAQKSEMLKAVFQRWGFDTNNDNIADAYGLARIAHALTWGSHDLPKFQVEVLSALTEHTESPHGGASDSTDH